MQSRLSEASVNVVENVACRLAERNGGRLTVNQLIPYLPMSLRLLRQCLDEMVDDAAVLAEHDGAHVTYLFSAYDDKPASGGILTTQACVACAADLASAAKQLLCPKCWNILQLELNRLAEQSGWPAEAVYEHEILYLAANLEPPISAAALAGHSRYTLRNMRRKLDRLTVEGYAEQHLDPATGKLACQFPAIRYPKDRYRLNMEVIQSYPASVTEEIELRIVRIVFALAIMVLALFVLAVFHVPYPILFVGFLIAAPITAIAIWKHRKSAVEPSSQ